MDAAGSILLTTAPGSRRNPTPARGPTRWLVFFERMRVIDPLPSFPLLPASDARGYPHLGESLDDAGI